MTKSGTSPTHCEEFCARTGADSHMSCRSARVTAVRATGSTRPTELSPGEAIQTGESRGAKMIAPLTAVVIPAALWAAFIFAMSTGAFSRRNSEALVARLNTAFGLHLPQAFLLRVLTIVRSSAHFAEFFVLVWLIDRVLAKLTSLSPLSSAACATAFATLYGLLDEIHQHFV